MAYPYFDLHFWFAVAAIGLGLSLMTYRLFALQYEWPMGEWHTDLPALPIVIGLICVLIGGLFAWARISGYGGLDYGGWAIPVLGIVFALLWTSLLRVGSQASLVLAPVATALLVIVWFGGPSALEYTTVRETVRQEFRDLRRELNLPPAGSTGVRDREIIQPTIRDRDLQPRDILPRITPGQPAQPR
jgi:hypothetical protein